MLYDRRFMISEAVRLTKEWQDIIWQNYAALDNIGFKTLPIKALMG